MAHHDNNFAINGHKVINNYSQKITPICCRAYGVNRLWQEVKNWQGDRLITEPQTF